MEKSDFEAGFREAERSLFLIAVGYLHNAEDAKDAVQEAALAALKGLDGLKNPEYFKTWLTRILINKCKSALRSRRAAPELSDEIGAFSRIPDEEIEIVDCLCRMDSGEAKYITLRFYGGLTYDEAARSLRQPVSTVKFRTKRALEKLKQMLEGDADE